MRMFLYRAGAGEQDVGGHTQYTDAWLCLGRWVFGVGSGYSPQPCLPADRPLPEGKWPGSMRSGMWVLLAVVESEQL